MDDTKETDTLTIQPLSLSAIETVDLSQYDFTNTWDGNASMSTISLTSGGNAGTLAPNSSSVYTIGNGGSGSTIWGTSNTYNWANTWTGSNSPGNVQIRGNVVVEGDQSDIFLRGQSLMDMLNGIQERLAWTVPNPELEAEWDELRELGERYRALEKQCREKADMWNKLKSMPPPRVDF